jgi:hypothetical protein
VSLEGRGFSLVVSSWQAQRSAGGLWGLEVLRRAKGAERQAQGRRRGAKEALRGFKTSR